MPVINPTIGCAKGDTFVFEIDMTPDADGNVPDLTGATSVEWYLAESWFEGAKRFLTKDLTSGVSTQSTVTGWKILVSLDPADTASVPPGLHYQKARMTLANGVVSQVEVGPFDLTPA